MKRLYSLLFLLLMLLNTIGYYEVLSIIERQLMDNAASKIAGNADEITGNLLLRVPMPLPYAHSDREYRSVVGEIVIEGQVYHYVKQKFYRDTLYIVCLKDSRATQGRNAIADYSGSFSDKNKRPGSSQKGLVLSLVKMYVLWEISSGKSETGWSRTLKNIPGGNLYSFSSGRSVFHPPC